MKVFIYRNLHTGKWSIKALEGPSKGLVIAHARAIVLSDVTPKVSQAGRQRVLNERKKYVHASLVGNIVSAFDLDVRHEQGNEIAKAVSTGVHSTVGSSMVSYNPYKYDYFFNVDRPELELIQADAAFLYGSGGVRTWDAHFTVRTNQLELAL